MILVVAASVEPLTASGLLAARMAAVVAAAGAAAEEVRREMGGMAASVRVPEEEASATSLIPPIIVPADLARSEGAATRLEAAAQHWGEQSSMMAEESGFSIARSITTLC